MATRTRKNSAAIAESVDTAPAVDTVTPDTADTLTDTAPTADTVTPTDSESADTPTDSDTAPALSYSVDGITVTVDPDRLDELATAVGSGRGARHNRALTVGCFIRDYQGMTPNRAHGILFRAGHPVHRDTINGAANAYALSAEFTPEDTLSAVGSVLADTLSLIDTVGIRRIKGTHNNVSVIDYDRLSALTDPADRESEFRTAILSALSAARNVVPAPADPADPEDTPSEDSDPVDSDPTDSEPEYVTPVDAWVGALADIAAAIHTAGALTGADRSALADAASAILSALADTADSIDRPDPIDTAGSQTVTPAPVIDTAADRLAARIDSDRAALAESAA